MTSYIRWDPNVETREYVQNLLKNITDVNNVNELQSILNSRLQFGTAGLRGPMGPGYNRMNDLVILQTAQGMVKYLLNTFDTAAKERGIMIGYDHRKKSSLSSLGFARMTAAVFLRAGFKVYLLEGFVPTPFVAFGVTHFNCVAGFMVTASHNPKQDNGFKVYWANGSQIIPPHDAGIAQSILNNLEPWHRDYDCEGVLSHPLASVVTDELAAAYYTSILKLSTRHELNKANTIRIAYTAMHGVGTRWVQKAFEIYGHPAVHCVESQCQPDAEFPTVTFPNPEEKGALVEAMRYAAQHDCSLIIANDPDADRLAIAERQAPQSSVFAAEGGPVWHLFSGNEVGVLLGHWQITQWKKRGGASGAALLASVVSSRMLKAVALAEGMSYYDTLTGFKWLGDKALQLRAAGIPVLLAYEEALGYCLGEVIVDKDGVSGAAVFAEMASALAEEGLTVKMHLQRLCDQYGEFVSYNSYVISHDSAVTNTIFERLRTGGPTGGHWSECCGSRVLRVKDVTTGYDSAAADGKLDLPITADSHMIMYEFDNGVCVTLRTSGTEPKIKYYTEIAGRPGQLRPELVTLLTQFVDHLVAEMLQPQVHNLGRP